MIRDPATHRFDVLLIDLDPTRGSEIRKTRPCVVVSPDEVNHAIRTLVVAPMTTGSHPYPTRVPVVFEGVAGHVVVDQLRTVDKARVVKRLGQLGKAEQQAVLRVLQAFFAG